MNDAASMLSKDRGSVGVMGEARDDAPPGGSGREASVASLASTILPSITASQSIRRTSLSVPSNRLVE
jgi:hypothetical protein